jgi:formate dehydrogenase maturation protein FdhE
MVREGLPQENWTTPFIWQSAILECRKRNMLIPFPLKNTREQINAQREDNDRKEGKPRLHESHTTDHSKNLLTQLRENVEATQRTAVAATVERQAVQRNAAQEQKDVLASIPVDVDFPQMSKEQKAQFKRLTSDSIKTWGTRHREWLRVNPPQEEQ